MSRAWVAGQSTCSPTSVRAMVPKQPPPWILNWSASCICTRSTAASCSRPFTTWHSCHPPPPPKMWTSTRRPSGKQWGNSGGSSWAPAPQGFSCRIRQLGQGYHAAGFAAKTRAVASQLVQAPPTGCGGALEDEMSITPIGQPCPKVSVASLHDKKLRHEPITCLTAYDYPSARLVDEAGIDVILVGDSLAQVVLGYDSTLPVTMEEMLHHTRAVRRAVKRAFLLADMPYASYHVTAEEAVRNATQFIKYGGAEAVKLEGGEKRIEIVHRLVDAEIPARGHIGLTPQSVNAMGGYKVQGKTLKAIEQLMRDAVALDEAGVCSMVLEGIPREVAAMITAEVNAPTIGIGAGPECDGQILVI